MMAPSSTESFPWLSAVIFSPLAAAAIAMLIRSDAAQRWWALFSTVAIAALSLPLWTMFDASSSAFQFVEQHPWIPWLKINYSLGIDGISLLLLLLTTLIAPLCVLCSWRYIKTRIKEFVTCLLIMETAMAGVFCALDFILFFIFWEAMLIPMAILIGVWGGPRRIYASLKFFIYTMAGSIFLLVAIIALGLHVGSFSIPEMMGHRFPASLQIWAFLAFFLSFAIKVPMFPFHTWLPAAHVEAPTAGSVLLASILLKMGAYGFVRFSLPITPYAAVTLAPWILWLSVVAIVYGGLTALAQRDLKKLVAYSSVSHMGFVTLGLFALNENGIEGAILQMINHGITTGALFICVGIVYERVHSRDLDASAGLGRQMPVFAGLFGVFCLSSLAFPGTNSFIGELLILAGGFAVSKTLILCAVPGVVLAAAYNLRMLQRVAYGRPENPVHTGIPDLNLREIATLLPLLIVVLWIGLRPGLFTGVMEASVRNLISQVRNAGLPAAPF